MQAIGRHSDRAGPSKVGHLFTKAMWTTRVLTVAPPLLLLMRLCPECSRISRLGIIGDVLFPILGVALAVSVALLKGSGRDALVILGSLGGGVLLALSHFAGIRPCPLCIAFWGLWMIQFSEVCISHRRLSALALMSALTVITSTALLTQSVEAKGWIHAMASVRFPMKQGLLPGSPMPKAPGVPEEGYIVFATACPTCWEERTRAHLSSIRKTADVSILIADGHRTPSWASSYKIVRVPRTYFSACNVDERGLPTFFNVKKERLLQCYGINEVKL